MELYIKHRARIFNLHSAQGETLHGAIITPIVRITDRSMGRDKHSREQELSWKGVSIKIPDMGRQDGCSLLRRDTSDL